MRVLYYAIPIHFKSIRKGENIMLKIKNNIKRFANEKKAEGFLDVAMKILIVVVIGAAILLIMNAAMPNLFQGLIDKISGELTGVNVLP
jgi:hypothetical protein